MPSARTGSSCSTSPCAATGPYPRNQAAYLTAFGDFLKINGEGIYGTRPWKTFGEGPLKVKDGRQGENHTDFSQEDIRFTTKDGVLYAFVLAPPTEDIVIKTLATGGLLDGEIVDITLMGSDEKIKWNRSADALDDPVARDLAGANRQRFPHPLKVGCPGKDETT